MSNPKIGRSFDPEFGRQVLDRLKSEEKIVVEGEPIHMSLTADAVSPPSPHTLDQCAEAVVAQLDGPLAEYVREIAMIHQRIPLWALVAGILNAAYEHGTLATPILSPSWPRSFAGVGLDLTTLTYDCRWCQKAFTPQRYKQGYCSQECGTLAAKAQAEAERTILHDVAGLEGGVRAHG